MAETSNPYVQVPLGNVDNSDILDFEEERIQKLRDKKMREEVEHQTKLRIQQIIDKNSHDPKVRAVQNHLSKYPAGQFMKQRRVNADKLPNQMQAIKFSTNQSGEIESELKTKNSFFGQSRSNFGHNASTSKLSVNGVKENKTQYGSESLNQFKSKPMPAHQIDISGQQAHPNEVIVPRRGVTLITGNGVVKKAYSQQNNYKQAESKGQKTRMTRAQYEQTRTSGLVISAKNKSGAHAALGLK
uniref:Uncharacterized protein n=1 Tax=Euplotes harpa TaxID=151035 RepID=A0A7S3J3Y7_9SPIT|mmetsp:Transcript_18652/g.21428  ORF Transcript_18652/g.21428 Transcript_18652/m.21428 type:complete len:243 (+) Transcript_18652:15-743(+)